MWCLKKTRNGIGVPKKLGVQFLSEEMKIICNQNMQMKKKSSRLKIML
jgi:hypothetical protein